MGVTMNAIRGAQAAIILVQVLVQAVAAVALVDAEAVHHAQLLAMQCALIVVLPIVLVAQAVQMHAHRMAAPIVLVAVVVQVVQEIATVHVTGHAVEHAKDALVVAMLAPQDALVHVKAPAEGHAMAHAEVATALVLEHARGNVIRHVLQIVQIIATTTVILAVKTDASHHALEHVLERALAHVLGPAQGLA